MEGKDKKGSSTGDGAGLPHPCVLLKADALHCLETAAKVEYEALALSILRGEEPGEEGEERLELLREFLETADFRSLRAQTEPLVRERGEVRALIFREVGGIRCRFLDS
ncbi:MAG: hypothetical protein WHT46_06830 [Candidatus Geothermincolales bacterium]